MSKKNLNEEIKKSTNLNLKNYLSSLKNKNLEIREKAALILRNYVNKYF
jgi:hypothetical protein